MDHFFTHEGSTGVTLWAERYGLSRPPWGSLFAAAQAVWSQSGAVGKTQAQGGLVTSWSWGSSLTLFLAAGLKSTFLSIFSWKLW